MAKKPPKPSLSVRAAHDPKLLARVLANPGLRSKLSDAQLTPAQRAKRQLNARLNAPVTPGSPMTMRDAARTANAQTTVKYGAAEQALGTELGHAQGLQRDTAGWYDQYKADLAQHAQNVQTIGGAAADQLKGQAGGIRGLDQSSLTAQQGAADASAAQRGATAGNLGPTASDASTVRQALLAAMAGSQTGANTANSTYADTLAKVVGPGQKLQAQAQAAGKVTDVRAKQTQLATEKGAFNLSARQQIAADELKNVLTGQALGLNTAKAGADIAATTARTTRTAADTAYFQKHGYYPRTGPPPKPAAPSGYKAGAPGLNKYGYTYDEWTALSPKAQAAARAGNGKPKKPGQGPTWQTPAQQGEANTQLTKLKTFANLAKTGQPFIPGHGKQAPASRAAAGKKILAAAPSLKDPVLLSAALDAVYDGHLSAETVQRLIASGYKPSSVAKTLGVPTSGQYRQGRGSTTYVRPPTKTTPVNRGGAPAPR